MATVTFDKATRVYPGSDKPAVDQLDLEIKDGEFTSSRPASMRSEVDLPQPEGPTRT